MNKGGKEVHPDRDRLAEQISNAMDKFEKMCAEWVMNESHDYIPFAEFVADYLLANDVIVQKQGKWVSAPIKDKGYDSKTIPTCTSCGYQSFITYTYCPECGAKLKEREG